MDKLVEVSNESIGRNRRNSIYIGENSQILSQLQQNYKIIYIDAPYNTGDEVFFDQEKNSWSHQVDWTEMIYSRVKQCYNLLDDNGVILFSIDDHELVSVRKILDNIFGKVNYLTTFVWRRRNFSDAHEDYISCDHEYIVCYSKSELKYLQKKISTWINCEDTLNYREDGFTDLIGSNQASARNHINKLFNNQVVTNYPKPVNLLTSLFSIFVEDGDRILDIFAGSGTTGEACMEISSQNNISVNFTLIQISKPKNNKLIHDVANLTVQRNKQAYKSISKKYAKLDGFSVYLISSLREENIFRNIGENYEK